MIKLESTIIEPYVGALPIKFGMSVNEVIDLLSSPESRKKTEFGLVFHYSGFNVMFSPIGQVEEVGFTKYFPQVLLNGEVVFGEGYDANTYDLLLTYDGKPFKTDGGALVFEKLGISLTGYPDATPESRALTCFVQGLWDFAIHK